MSQGDENDKKQFVILSMWDIKQYGTSIDIEQLTRITKSIDIQRSLNKDGHPKDAPKYVVTPVPPGREADATGIVAPKTDGRVKHIPGLNDNVVNIDSAKRIPPRRG